MPLLSTLGNAGVKAYGGSGISPGGSFIFDNTGDYLQVPSSSAFAYGTGNFTIESWIYPVSYADYRVIWRQATNVYLYTNRTTGQLIFYYGASSYPFTTNGMTLNAWNHVAVVRNGGSIRIFLNGIAYPSIGISANFGNPSINPLIGRWLTNNNSYQFFGYITNFRIAKQALYTANFTPSLTPFTRTSQGSSTTQLLLNVKSPSALNIDSSSNSITVTNNNVTYSTLSPYTVPYVTPPTVIVVSATVTASTTTPGEGTTVTFNVAGENTANGTYYYTIEQGLEGSVSAEDFTSNSLSGSFTISGNAGSFTITPTKDLLTEGSENFVVFVRSGAVDGTVIGASDEITITDVSITPAFTSVPASINEGSSGTFTVQNIGPNGTYYWTILNGTTASADFSASSGSFTVSGSTGGIDNGSGSFSVTAVADRVTEGSQTFQVQVRSGSTSGPVIITSSSVTINDISLTPAFTVTPSSINEGSSGTFAVNNLGAPGTYYWTISNVTTTNADFSAVSGSFTTSTLNGSGSFLITPVFDYTTDSARTFQVQVREGSISGTILVTSNLVTVNDTSTTVSASSSSSNFNEGTSVTITASATAFPNGTYYWTILNETTTNDDFIATSGSFTVSNGTSGSFVITAASFDGIEGSETFRVQIRRDSTSGTVIATTGAITINSSGT